MLDYPPRDKGLPNAPGVGFKPQHFTEILADPGPVEWVEVHAENYMGDGGRPQAQLQALAERFAISVHGVGLSIGGKDPLNTDHLDRLKRLCARIPTARFSEHLAWSTHGAEYMNDLLPLPYTERTVSQVCAHIDQVQATLNRQMLLENPSNYLVYEETDLSETDFLRAVTQRTGCGLLLDINNVFISSTNLQQSAQSYLDDYPLEQVHEIHVGGHDEDRDDHGALLLIDSHGKPVVDPVWALLDDVVARTGPKPVLVEWDNDVPDWPTLRREALRAAMALA